MNILLKSTVLLFLTECYMCTTNRDDETEIYQLLFPPKMARRYAHAKQDAYFGYSVASYVGQSQAFCLVGAPRARYDPFDSRDLPGKEEPSTGLVYRLELDPILPSCSLVPIATTDEMRMEYTGSKTSGISSWLGGSVAAASNSVDGIQLGCDPRFVSVPDPLTSRNHTTLQPTGRQTASVHPQTPLGVGQCALYTGASMGYTVVDVCSIQEEGACLAGFSSDVEAGDEIGEALVALGLPGSYLTEGNVFLGRYRGRELVHAMRLKTSPQDLKHKGFNLGYAVHLAKLIRSPDSNPQKPSEASLSDIYSLLRSRQLSSQKYDYSLLVTSPFWFDNDYRGLVMILDQNLEIGGITYLKDNWSHIGSFFGYSLTTADLDGNGIADIIVGAPYYTEKHKDEYDDPVVPASRNSKFKTTRDTTIKTSNNVEADESKHTMWRSFVPDMGRVYIFYGHQSHGNAEDPSVRLNQLDYTNRPPVVLQGLKLPWGRFGHAVVSLGDVDGDGTEDIAVSCPYCSDHQKRRDKGAVFIYLGRKETAIKDKPFQIIWSGDVPSESPQTTCGDFSFEPPKPRTFQGFGWSLSGAADLDGNHAPDLIVGDFESSQVVMLPAINTLWFDNPNWDLPKADSLPWSGPNGTPCGARCVFRVRLTVTIHGRKQLLHSPLEFNARVVTDLDAEMEGTASKRLSGTSMLQQPADNGLGATKSAYGRMETMVTMSPGKNLERMTLLDISLDPELINVRNALWKPIKFNVSVSPVFDSPSELDDVQTSSWTLHPFLGVRRFVSPPMYFNNPECGVDNVCHADLQVRLADYHEGGSNTENQVVYFRERISQRNLTVLVRNMGENAYAAKLRLQIPYQFSLTIPTGLLCQTSNSGTNVTDVLCNMGDPLPYTGSTFRSFIFQLNTAGAFRSLDEPVQNDQTQNDASSDAVEDSNFKDFLVKESFEQIFTPNSSISRTPEQWRYRARRPRDICKQNSVTITAEVISGNLDADSRNNKATLTYQLRLAADIEISSSSLDRTTIDSRNFTVQFYEMQRVHPDTIGPEVKHIYLVSNAGPSPVEELWVNVTVPLMTKDGEHLLYLLDRIRYQAEDGGPALFANMAPEVISAEGQVRGYCVTPEWALNPLKFKAVHRGRRNTQKDSGDAQDQAGRVGRRQRRSTDNTDVLKEEHILKWPVNSNGVRSVRSVGQGTRKRQQEIIKCGQEFDQLKAPVCVTINCRIDQLSRGDAVRIVLRGYVWADTFFRHKISDFAIVSEAKSQLKAMAFGIPVHGNLTVQPMVISQNFVFDGIQVPLFRQFPLWPIILGVVLGLALLTCIFLGMWKCGFFRRHKIQDGRLPVPPNAMAPPPPVDL